MNKLKTCVLVFALVLITLALPVVAQDEDEQNTEDNLVEYTVTGETANLRSGPGTSTEVIDTAGEGDSLLIYDEDPEVAGWLRIYREDEEDAYIADFLVERAPIRFYSIEQEPIITVEGRGSDVSDIVDLPRGAYRIDATVEDNAFILSTVVVEGDCRDDSIFNELNFDVNQLTMSGLFVSQGCSLLFETDNVDGDWMFEIRDLLEEDFLIETALIIEDETSISGTGRAVTMATLISEGVWLINAEVDDNAFILRPQVLDGDCDGTSVFNEFISDENSLELRSAYRVEEDGCIIFWETSNVEGDWTLVFESAS